MKKIVGIISILLMILCVEGCGQQKQNEVNTSNSEQSAVALTKNETERTLISGEFTVGVRELISGFGGDDTTPEIAIVAEYQNYPFTMYVGEDIGSQLEKDEIYVFSIEPFEVDGSVEELEEKPLSSIVWEMHNYFNITGFRLAEEDELGMGSLTLSFTKVEE